jgi:hypothetical protein
MKKFLSLLVSVFCVFFGHQDNGLAFFVQPQPLPYSYNGHVYNHAFAQKMSESFTMIQYCESDGYDIAHDVSNGTIAAFCGGANQDYSNLGYALDANYGMVLCFSADCSSSYTSFGSGPSMMGYNAVATPLSENLYVSVDVIDKDTHGVVMSANWVPPDTPFGFPLQTTCSGNPCTAYTAGVSSVMDQSMPGGPYTKNGITQAFNGEEGDVDTGCWCYSTSSVCNSGNYQSCAVPGYLKTGGGSWLLSSAIEYDDTYLYYDGHPGYDYPAPLQEGERMDINAPESGALCVATTTTEPDDPPVLWRDTTRCPHATAGGTSWSGYHTFYIIHEGLRMNGVAGKCMTVFLHNDSLSSTVQSAIEQNGYAEVSKDNFIAKAGGWGPSGANHYSLHMHFEVYKWNGSSWDRVDPYGDGLNNILWEH